MEFFIKNTLKYQKPVIEEWRLQLERVLFDLIKRIKTEKFIERIGKEDYNFIDERETTTITMNHFKGLRNMLLANRYVNGHDFWHEDTIIYNKTKKGTYSETKKRDFLNYDTVMLFKKCSHFYPANENKLKGFNGGNSFCKICEETNESFECNILFNFIR